MGGGGSLCGGYWKTLLYRDRVKSPTHKYQNVAPLELPFISASLGLLRQNVMEGDARLDTNAQETHGNGCSAIEIIFQA